VLDSFIVKGLRVVEGEKGLFVSMPSEAGKDGKWYSTVIPLKREVKDEIEKIVLPSDLEKMHGVIKNLPAHSVSLFHKDDLAHLYQLTLTSKPYNASLPESLTTLDVYMLHEVILAKQLGITSDDLANHTYITYKRDPAGTCKAVIEGKEQMAFLLKPTDVEDVIRVARDRQTMPQKSTDFFPKFLTGYVIADVATA